MRWLFIPFAAAGFAAIAWRAARTLLQLGQGGVAALLAADLATTHARRGDLTALGDAAAMRALAVRRRRLALAATGFWLALLLLPLLTPWPALLYAGYSVLWLLPRARSQES